jgi:hypothetical protein
MRTPSDSFRAIRGTALLLVLCCSGFIGCRSRDVSRHPRDSTDFRVGQVYQLKVPAFIVANTGLVMTEEAGRRAPIEVETFLDPGTYFTVRQIVAVKDRTDGPRTEIYAEIVTGPRKGRLVNLRTASLSDGATGVTRLDPAVLETFFLGR